MIAVLTVMSGMDLSHNWLRFDWVGFVGFKSSWFNSWHAAGAKPVGMVLGFATGGMPASVGFDYRCDFRALVALVTMGNLGVSSCLDVV
jgi:hypothetical protein